MPLHPQARQLIDTLEAAGLPTLPELSPPAAREQAKLLNQIVGPGPEVAIVKDFTIPVTGASIGARLYEPAETVATIFSIHGGGWTICDLDSHDAMCRVLANSSGCRVVAIDTEVEMAWFEANYVPDPALRENPEVSPLKADSLAGLPPAIVVTAEYDPLCDQGVAYAERLANDGVPVTHHHYDDQIHAFFTLVNIFESADEAVPKVGAEIRDAVASAVA